MGTGLIVLVSVGCCVLLMHLFSDIIQDMVGSRLADVFTMENMYVPVLTVLLLFWWQVFCRDICMPASP